MIVLEVRRASGKRAPRQTPSGLWHRKRDPGNPNFSQSQPWRLSKVTEARAPKRGVSCGKQLLGKWQEPVPSDAAAELWLKSDSWKSC